MQRTLSSPIIGLLVLVSSSGFCQDIWTPAYVVYRSDTVTHSVPADHAVYGSVILTTAFHNNSQSTFSASLALTTPYEVMSVTNQEQLVPGSEYQWEFPDIPPGVASWLPQVDLDPATTGLVSFTPGFSLSRSTAPTRFEYPGGEQRTTVSFTFENDVYNDYTADSLTFQIWAILPWEEPTFSSYPTSFTPSDGVDCHMSDWYIFCGVREPGIGTTYSVEVIFEVLIDEGVVIIECAPFVLGEVRFWESQSIELSESVTLSSEWGTWTWTTQEEHWYHRSLVRSKQVALLSSAAELVFDDGFESGDSSQWSSTMGLSAARHPRGRRLTQPRH